MRTVGLILGLLFFVLGALGPIYSANQSSAIRTGAVAIAGAILYAGATIAEAIADGAKRKDVI